MKNQLIAKIFYNIADLLDLQSIPFKPRAYRRAALAIESLGEDIDLIKDLRSIPGVGEHLEKKIIEILKTGRLKYYERLKRETPIDIESLNNIQGLGPKRIKLLYTKYKLKNIQDLKKLIKQHKIKELIGEKTEKNLEESIDFARKKTKGFLLGFIWEDASKIKHKLEKQNFILKAEIAGSFRRRKEIVNDLDILVTSNKSSKVINFFTRIKGIKKILTKGMTKSSIILENDLQIDLRVIKEESFGAALQYFTGSKLHNIHLRKIAIKKGYRLSEYGLFKNNKLIASKTEKEIYNKLSLPYIEPELREDRGEFEKQPNLITLSDIKGDLHIHTNYSDGEDSIKEMVEKARFLKYKYIGITDHFGSLKIANSMDIKRFNNQKKEIN
ncbi:MAG TPA: PHP domain-containing protein, partial [Candidatus Nanoarchaeia archaeon]|nr:PHP domain-containing protein [Candidatus Nanoarchaeia archaeon]